MLGDLCFSVRARVTPRRTPRDPDDLAVKVEWAWTHPERMEEMGRAARAEYEAKYTAERIYQMLMDIIREEIQQVDWTCIFWKRTR